MSLRIRPITIKAAMKLVAQWHRHLPRVTERDLAAIRGALRWVHREMSRRRAA